MSSGLASLHKILKDETRRKIVLLLNEKGSLSYTDLMKNLETVSTGLLNYHLKVLNDLLVKNEIGQYTLSEKGKLASKLSFPEEKSFGKPKWWRKFWIANGILAMVLLIIHLASYFLGYIDMAGLYRGLLWIVGAVGVAYTIQHIIRDVISEKSRVKVRRISILLFGTVSIGGFLWIALMSFLNLSGIKSAFNEVMDTFAFAVILLVACYITGVSIGGWINKRMVKNQGGGNLAKENLARAYNKR